MQDDFVGTLRGMAEKFSWPWGADDKTPRQSPGQNLFDSTHDGGAVSMAV